MKKIFFIFLFMLFLLSATGYGNTLKNGTIRRKILTFPEAQMQTLAGKIVKSMTLEEKIGQMMIVGIDGTSVDKNAIELLEKYHVGGIIFFDKNMQSKSQVRVLISELNAKADDKDLPLFMAIDQEGGKVTRMSQALYTAPAAAALAAEGDGHKIYQAARMTALDIKRLGFNLNFAPVLDLDYSSKERSYGKTAAQVVQNAGIAAQGYEDSGILFAFKHFPGIGKGVKDTHVGASSVVTNKETLMKEDVFPFKELIHRFPNDEFMVMTGHLQYQVFSNLPASVDKQIVTDLLRRELGFTGVAITDDMGMGALRENFTPGQAGIKAVQAGEDILLVCHGQLPKVQVYEAVLAAVKSGQIPASRIDEAATRIVLVKLKNLVTYRELKQFAEIYTK